MTEPFYIPGALLKFNLLSFGKEKKKIETSPQIIQHSKILKDKILGPKVFKIKKDEGKIKFIL